MAEDYDGVIGIVFQRSNPVKYLLIHNQKTGNITFPAGGREDGEVSSRQSLKRELREETGLILSECKVIETPVIHEFIYNSKKTGRAGQTARQPVYLIETEKLELNPEDPDSVIYGWYPAEETIKRLTFPDSKELFKKAIKYIKLDFKFKNDKYRAARGNRTRLVDLFCRVCDEWIMIYQKDDYPGRLRRLYFDRIFFPEGLTNLESRPLDAVPALTCPNCKESLATPYIYKKEDRKAFKVYQDALIKKPRRLKGD